MNDRCQQEPPKNISRLWLYVTRVQWWLKGIYRKSCYILPHKWELHDNQIYTGHIDLPFMWQTSYVICKRCNKHLFNGISNIKKVENV